MDLPCDIDTTTKEDEPAQNSKNTPNQTVCDPLSPRRSRRQHTSPDSYGHWVYHASKYPIANYVSYNNFTSEQAKFLQKITKTQDPTFFEEAAKQQH